MQRIKRVHGLVALIVGAVLCLALGSAFAWAEGEDSNTGSNQLQVYLTLDKSEQIASESVEVRLYKIASANKDSKYDTYNYTFDVEGFTDLGKDFDQASIAGEGWQEMADAAKELVTAETPVAASSVSATDEVGSLATFANIADGLYLVLVDDTATASYEYSFVPAIVSLPSKVDATGAMVFDTSEGRWTNTEPEVPVVMFLKYQEKARHGDLVINKVVTDFKGEPATFVFHVVDTATNGDIYDNYAAITYPDQTSTTLTQIPAGIEITVSEVYFGARYEIDGPNDLVVTTVANESVSVSFTNAPNGSPTYGGHGIENHFVFDDKGDWPHSRTPEATE